MITRMLSIGIQNNIIKYILFSIKLKMRSKKSFHLYPLSKKFIDKNFSEEMRLIRGLRPKRPMSFNEVNAPLQT